MTVYIVYGAPTSGKTTYVQEHVGYNDIVYDFDSIHHAITGLPYQDTNQYVVSYVMRIRDAIISRLHEDDRTDNAYLITTFVGKNFEQSLQGLDLAFIRMQTSKKECIDRLSKTNRRDKEELFQVVDEWFDKYGKQGEHIPLKERKKIYNSKAWKQLREEVLQRDNYECIWCKAEGKVTIRDREILEVDHIREIERAPELAMDEDNLRTLCRSCHSKRHNRAKRNPIQMQGSKNKWADDEWW